MQKLFKHSTIAAALALALSACGGGDGTPTAGGSASDPNVVASGVIQGFGSVIVNGVKYEVEGNIVTLESDDNGTDRITDQSGLQIGMNVTVTGTVNPDGVTGSAQSIRFDGDLKGPISAVTTSADGSSKELTVLGVTVVVSATDTVFDDTPAYSFDTIAQNDLVEVSGLIDDQGRLVATYIEKKPGTFTAGVTLVEVKGLVAGLDEINQQFNLGSLRVAYTSDALDDSLGNLANDLFVEAKGTLSADGTTLTATQVEREGLEDTPSGAQAHVEGLIGSLDPVGETFSIGAQVVSYSGTVEYEPASLEGNLAEGIKVEAEGPIVDGVLQAREIKIRGNQIRISADVFDRQGEVVSFRLIPGNPDSAVSVTLDTNTRTEDGIGAAGDINIGDFLELRARPDVDNPELLIATRVERETESDDFELQGPIEAIDLTNGTITVLGVTYQFDGDTEYEGLDDQPMTADQFFAIADVGVLVKVKDKNDANDVADGVADELDLES